MHSMREDRLQEHSSCQCFLCISAIISCTRCARTDCKNTRVASVSCVFPPSFHAFDARGPIARVPELPLLLLHRRHHKNLVLMHSMCEDRLQECPSCQCFFCIEAITK